MVLFILLGRCVNGPGERVVRRVYAKRLLEQGLHRPRGRQMTFSAHFTVPLQHLQEAVRAAFRIFDTDGGLPSVRWSACSNLQVRAGNQNEPSLPCSPNTPAQFHRAIPNVAPKGFGLFLEARRSSLKWNTNKTNRDKVVSQFPRRRLYLPGRAGAGQARQAVKRAPRENS